MQLIDEDHLLIKYACEDVVTLQASEPNSQASFFAFYSISKAEVRFCYPVILNFLALSLSFSYMFLIYS